MTKERIEKLLKAGANVVLTTKGIDDMALKASFIWLFSLFYIFLMQYEFCSIVNQLRRQEIWYRFET